MQPVWLCNFPCICFEDTSENKCSKCDYALSLARNLRRHSVNSINLISIYSVWRSIAHTINHIGHQWMVWSLISNWPCRYFLLKNWTLLRFLVLWFWVCILIVPIGILIVPVGIMTVSVGILIVGIWNIGNLNFSCSWPDGWSKDFDTPLCSRIRCWRQYGSVILKHVQVVSPR